MTSGAGSLIATVTSHFQRVQKTPSTGAVRASQLGKGLRAQGRAKASATASAGLGSHLAATAHLLYLPLTPGMTRLSDDG